MINKYVPSAGAEKKKKNVKYTKTQIHKYTNTQISKYTIKKCLEDPTCASFFKSMGFKDIKYDIPVYQM